VLPRRFTGSDLPLNVSCESSTQSFRKGATVQPMTTCLDRETYYRPREPCPTINNIVKNGKDSTGHYRTKIYQTIIAAMSPNPNRLQHLVLIHRFNSIHFYLQMLQFGV